MCLRAVVLGLAQREGRTAWTIEKQTLWMKIYKRHMPQTNSI
jgi:hypothetical protein